MNFAKTYLTTQDPFIRFSMSPFATGIHIAPTMSEDDFGADQLVESGD